MGNLAAVGFTATSTEALQATVDQALARAVESADLGEWAKRHVWFRDASGAAIAVHFDEETINCLTPFFLPDDGGTTWRVASSAPHRDKECDDCSGADCDVLEGSPPEMVTRTAVQWLYFDAYADWLREERQYDLQVVGFASAM